MISEFIDSIINRYFQNFDNTIFFFVFLLLLYLIYVYGFIQKINKVLFLEKLNGQAVNKA